MSVEQPDPRPAKRRWFQLSLRAMLILVALCAVGMFVKLELEWRWKKGIAAKWVEEYASRSTESTNSPRGVVPACPQPLSKVEQLEVLRIAISSLATPRQRAAGLGLLVHLYPEKVGAILPGIIRRPKHPQTRGLCLRVLGLLRREKDASLALSLLEDEAAEVRAGAAECLGLIHRPSYSVPLSQGGWWLNYREPAVDCDPRSRFCRCWVKSHPTPPPP